ncbi:hypothetical protein Fmac_020755 [Flemingia macrophylla]|uniref:Pentatricopeptide repeat-containing protein n=1 Tax=Flemingia macrophylla TaxID=520843 RepID=A0ABD1LUX5_9FABA
MNCMARSGEVAAVNVLGNDMIRLSSMLENSAVGCMLKSFCISERIEEALELICNLKNKDLDLEPEYYETLVHGIIINGYEEACILYDEMLGKGIKPDIVAITAMVSGHVSHNRISEAWKMFNSMESQGIKPTWKSYAVFIKELCKASRTDEIVKVLQKMQASNIKIQDIFFHQVLTYMENKGELTVREKVHQMPKAFTLDPEKFMDSDKRMKADGYSPSRSTYKYMITALCKEASMVLEATRCTDSLQIFGYTVPLSYSLFIRALCRAGRVEKALPLLEEVGEEKSILDQLTCGSIVHGLLRKGRLEEALTKVDAMKHKGIAPTIHVYTSPIVHFFKEKQVEKAIEIFKEMQRSGYEPTIVAYSALVRGYVNVGRPIDEWDIFYRMKIKGLCPDFKTYSMFVTCLCKVERSEGMKLFSKMLDSGIVPSIVNFRTVFYGLNKEGKNDLARVVLQQKSEDASTLIT